MAKLYFLLSITVFLAIFASARHSPSRSNKSINDSPFNTTKNYTYVCNPSRFEELGLDIKSFAYCDKSLPYDVRVKDLIDRMTLSEKVKQISDTARGVPPLGLPKYEWWSEALHGISNVGQGGSKATFFDEVVPGATSFPTVILTTTSFNESLWKTIGQAVSTEARAMYNLGHVEFYQWLDHEETEKETVQLYCITVSLQLQCISYIYSSFTNYL